MTLLVHTGATAAPIHDAVNAGKVAAVKQLLDDDPQTLEKPDNNLDRPLHLAIRSKNLPLTKLPLEKGADVNVSGADGMTPLHYSAVVGSGQLTALLLTVGAILFEHPCLPGTVTSLRYPRPLKILFCVFRPGVKL